ncbi:MAG: DNA cytosine methyltransferase [Bacteroidetes bacterium]|nr:DNA cytosine methyltransferase [Bacteroidota bacterium]
MKVLNLYACLGGNRLLWENCEVTAVEIDPGLAQMYKDKFTNDTVIVADAHQYLLDHYKEFDFIWSSPPCPTHSVTNHFLNAQGIIRYPDMGLWQEIIFLKHFFKGKYCVENVTSYYEPMFNPKKIGRHYLWSNFLIPTIPQPKKDIGRMNGKRQSAGKKTKEERNAVNSELGLHILNTARGIIIDNNIEQGKLF